MSLAPGRVRLGAAVFLCALPTAAAGGPVFAQQPANGSAPAAKKLVNPQSSESPDATAMRALRSKTAFHVERMPLRIFATFLSNKYNVRFKLDQAGLKRARVDPGTPISADIDGMPLSEALKEVLGGLKLTHQVIGGEISITERPPDAPEVQFVVVPALPQVQADQFLVVQPPQNGGLQFLSQLPVELRFVKRACAPTKEQMRAIKADLEQCLRDAGSGAIPASCEVLPDKLAACVVRHLSPAEAARYRDEVHKHRAREREACVYTFITLLDQRIGLADDQRQSLVAALEARWKPGWSQQIEMAVRNGDDQMPGIPDELIVPLLDGEQAKLWKELPKHADANPRFDPDRMGSVGTPIDDPETYF
jgi:hypothetical protein